MFKISGPIGAVLFATITLASANSGFLVDSAHADTCAAAPKGAAPSGQHWYYHVDRATRHKCWYLHASVALPRRAMIRHQAAATENTDAAPTPQTAAAPVAAPTPPESPAGLPAPPTPTPDSSADNAPPAPHVTVLAVKTSTPFVTTTPAPQQNTADTAPATAPVAAQTTLPRTETMPAVAAPKPVADPDGAAPQDKADATLTAQVQTAAAAIDAARTRTAEEFILLALVLGAAAAVTALISKIVNAYRKPRISVDPDAAWLSFRAERQRIDAEAEYEDPDVPFLDPQEQYGLADLHTQEWLDRSAPQQHQSPVLPQHTTKIPQQPARHSQADIEPALRALRQARQRGLA